MKKSYLIVLLILTILITGCSSANYKTPVSMKESYAKEFSNGYVEYTETITDLSILLYKMALQNEVPEISKFKPQFEDYFKTFEKGTNSDQQIITANLKEYYKEYLAYGLTQTYVQMMKQKNETGETSISKEELDKSSEKSQESIKKLSDILNKQMKYFN